MQTFWVQVLFTLKAGPFPHLRPDAWTVICTKFSRLTLLRFESSRLELHTPPLCYATAQCLKILKVGLSSNLSLGFRSHRSDCSIVLVRLLQTVLSNQAKSQPMLFQSWMKPWEYYALWLIVHYFIAHFIWAISAIWNWSSKTPFTCRTWRNSKLPKRITRRTSIHL